MAKDYFQDIVPPSDDAAQAQPAPSEAIETQVPIRTRQEADAPERSIRNISAPARQRPLPPPPSSLGSVRGIGTTRSARGISKVLLWAAAAIGVLIVAALLFVALRPTRVTVVPKSHALSFSGDVYVAYPEGLEALGGLTYTVQENELEDSEVVKSQGTVYAEEKSTGNITVYNDYQSTPLKLIKNTRFETSNGLVYRTPAEIVVPAKKGATPGSVVITVVADQPGEKYNVGASKFTLPGLKSTADMYAKVYAESTVPFTGGFAGERPGVAPADLEQAIASVRSRLEAKVKESASVAVDGTVSFPELAQIEFQTLPNTTEAGDSVRIHQKAVMRLPVFDAAEFASAVAGSAVDTDSISKITLEQGSDFSVETSGTSTVLSTGPLSLSIRGQARIVWQVDVSALQVALAGADKSAFEAIVSGFPSIQEASARIEPFWKGAFPAAPEDIKVSVENPSAE